MRRNRPPPGCWPPACASNLGDITTVDFAALAATVSRPAALTAGFPCQDISNAGTSGRNRR
ncbi:DNA cytosine methyltransferase [Streptomyces sp. NPDC004324]